VTDAYGFDSLPVGVGLFGGKLIVCASGRSLWHDLTAVDKVWGNGECDVMAVKTAGLFIPFDFQHWAGQHGERFQWMVPLRGYHFHKGMPYRECKARVHSDESWPFVTDIWRGKCHGTSGLFAVRVALALGYDEIVLCGMPLDGSGRFYDAPWANGGGIGKSPVTQQADLRDMTEWERCAKSMFNGRVKSMSGKSRELLGEL
jgi:hypothetical protein